MKARIVALAALAAWLGAAAVAAAAGERRVRVEIRSHETGRTDAEALQGSGSITITRRGLGSAGTGFGTESRTTTTRRTSGVFTLVQDGGEASIASSTRVPFREVAWFRDRLTGAGYVSEGVVFESVGTSLKVAAEVLDGDRVRLRLTPSVSWLSADGSGAIDVTESSTELVVRSGEPVPIGGATRSVDEMTRRILGYASTSASRESSLELVATVE